MRLRRDTPTILMLMCFTFALMGLAFYAHANDEETGLDSPSYPDQRITRITIKVRDLSDNEDELAGLARNLIVLREGDRFSPDLLQESIEALRVSKRFSEIHVDSEREKEGVALLFDLKAFRLIKDIKIYGEFPLFEREILKAMRI